MIAKLRGSDRLAKEILFSKWFQLVVIIKNVENVNVCVWRFWWCQDKSNTSFISSPNQDQENKDQEES